MGVHAKRSRIANSTAAISHEEEERLLQQKCLDIFKIALWTSDDDLKTLQEVKGHLYNRDFAQAFSKAEYLRVYALRWSASRALGYAAIFRQIEQQVSTEEDIGNAAKLRILSIGGGAGAELVGLAAWLTSRTGSVSFHAVDIADWQGVVEQLYSTLTTPPRLSQYASAAAIAKNKEFLLSTRYAMSFTKADVLEWDLTAVESAVAQVNLITIMFTLNELYTTSVAKTQQLLGMITDTIQTGSLLLIVDSPGSYSTVSINGTEKRYPMQWLLDHTLLGDKKPSTQSKWQKLVSEESQWFRVPQELQYPVELENMRYQIHLYKRGAAEEVVS